MNDEREVIASGEGVTPLARDRSELPPRAERSKAKRKPRRPRMRKLQFTVDEDTVEQLQQSKEFHNDSSLAQSFRRATKVSSFLDKMHSDGFEVFVKKGDEITKIFIP